MAPATSRRSRSPARPLAPRASRSDRPWAIITGASSGIGHALATEAAKRGCNVVLVARRAAALADLAAALELHGAQTQVVPLCLAQPESAVALHEATAPIADRVELLVANAGRSWAGPLAAQPAEVLDQMLELNMATVARLCRLYAADFARRGRGALLLTSSLVALAPLPHATIYGASRAFVRSLALGLRDECAPAGVVVACLLPGATATEFAKVGGTERAMVFNLPLGIGDVIGLVLPAEQVASAAFDGLAAGTLSIVPGFLNRVYAASTCLLTARAAAAFSSAVFGDDSPLASASNLLRALPALLIGTAAVVAALPLQAAREALCWLLTALQWLLAPVGRLLLLPLPGVATGGRLAPAGGRRWDPRPRPDERGRLARGCCWAVLLAFAWAKLRLPTPQAQARAHTSTPLREMWRPSGEAATSHARVAVIGAGVGGAFASDTLRALGPNLRIDVYEGSARVGGRAMDSSALGEAPSEAVELGASMFIGDNRLIAEAAASLGLNTSCRHDDAQAL